MRGFLAGMIALMLLLVSGNVFGEGQKEAAQGKKTLTFLTWMDWTAQNPRSDVYNEAKAKFEEEHPEFVLEVRTLPWSEVITQITVMHEAGDTPDIVGMGQVGMRAQIDAGRVMDLTPFYDRTPGMADAFKSANLRVATVDGKYYCIPHLTDLTLVTYRKDLFKKAGLDPDRGPATWNETYAYAEKLTKENQWGAAFTADMSGWLPQHWAPLVEMAGGHLIDSQGRSDMNNPGAIAAVQFYVDLVQKYKAAPAEVVGLSPANMREGLIQGNFAMTLNDGHWNYFEKYVPAVGEENLGWEMYSAPRAGVKRVDHSSGWSFMIFKQAKYPEAAFDFAVTMNRPEYLDRLAEAGYGLPIRSEGIEAVKDRNPDVYKWALAARDSVPVPPTPYVVELWEIVAKNMERAIQGQISAAEALQATDTEFNRKFK